MSLYPAIENFLKECAGISPNSTPGMIDRIVKRILDDRKFRNENEYLNLLKESQTEFDAFLEEVLVPETWFFRYPASFEFLKHAVVTFRKPIRILSVPCSSGEEPYSIAITLVQAGFLADQFKIDAADVSDRALEKAEQATYRKNSFREQEQTFAQQYFMKHGTEFQLKDSIRRLVTFTKWNVLQRPPAQLRPAYDIIFCRNLLIYFHKTAQSKMVTIIEGLLNRNGLLFVGHAEAGPLISNSFQPIEPLKAFAHCRAPAS
jgi:chemotaxis protein methyltransferase WspC